MWVEVVRVRPPANPAQPAGEGFRQTALPRLQQMRGFAGAVMLRSRTEQLGATATYWNDREAYEAARSDVEAGRNRAAQDQGFEVLETDQFEVVALDRKGYPAVGQFVRSTDGKGDPARREEGARMIQERIVPLVSEMPGYVSLIAMANPDSGRIVTSSTWATEEDLKGSGDAVSAARNEVVQGVGGSVDRIEEWQVVLAELQGRG